MAYGGDSGKRTGLLRDALKQPQIRDTQLASAKDDVPSILQSHVSEQNTMFWVSQLHSDGDVATIPVGSSIPFTLLLLLIMTAFDRVSYQEFISRNKKKHRESKVSHLFTCSCWEAPCKGQGGAVHGLPRLGRHVHFWTSRSSFLSDEPGSGHRHFVLAQMLVYHKRISVLDYTAQGVE